MPSKFSTRNTGIGFIDNLNAIDGDEDCGSYFRFFEFLHGKQQMPTRRFHLVASATKGSFCLSGFGSVRNLESMRVKVFPSSCRSSSPRRDRSRQAFRTLTACCPKTGGRSERPPKETVLWWQQLRSRVETTATGLWPRSLDIQTNCFRISFAASRP
jgi:hypothetical protein